MQFDYGLKALRLSLKHGEIYKREKERYKREKEREADGERVTESGSQVGLLSERSIARV